MLEIDTTKEKVKEAVSKLFGLELVTEELEEFWKLSQDRMLTPLKEGVSILFSPLMIQSFVNIALRRKDFSSTDKRFKKIVEEIIPAIDFVLFLKMSGMGEHLILSSDVPDIVLVKKEDIEKKQAGKISRIPAVPIEVTFIKKVTLEKITGANDTERVANAIILKKFNKAYDSRTTLLVVLDAELGQFSLKELSDHLSNKKHCFHNIWLYMVSSEDKHVIAQLYPVLRSKEFDSQKDLRPLMY